MQKVESSSLFIRFKSPCSEAFSKHVGFACMDSSSSVHVRASLTVVDRHYGHVAHQRLDGTVPMGRSAT
jgi:hypothetical protein